jgi:hypothetical protein
MLNGESRTVNLWDVPNLPSTISKADIGGQKIAEDHGLRLLEKNLPIIQWTSPKLKGCGGRIRSTL